MMLQEEDEYGGKMRNGNWGLGLWGRVVHWNSLGRVRTDRDDVRVGGK